MGGNVFDDKTSNIKLENITPTLNTYFSELKQLFPKKANIFDEYHFHPVGSVRKKDESGDIDLAVSKFDILDETMSDESISLWNIDPNAVLLEFESLKRRARTSTDSQLRMKAFLKLLAVYINTTAPMLHCSGKKVTDGNLFGLYPQITANGDSLDIGVQIDWMVGDLKWLMFSYYSDILPKNSNVKGLHRTQLILAAFQVANLSFNHINGIKDKDTGEVVSTDPNNALRLLSNRLNIQVTVHDAENYYKLYDILSKQLKKDEYNMLLDIYFKILDSTRADIPDNLQEEWLFRKDQLGLTGKFLPDNSILKGYV